MSKLNNRTVSPDEYQAQLYDFTVHEYHKEVGLNDYERFYFKHCFGDNLERLKDFRKKVSKEQKDGWYRGEPYVVKVFKDKGGKNLFIQLNRKKVDAYIREVEAKNNK